MVGERPRSISRKEQETGTERASVESKIKNLSERMSELKDLQMMNKLDIINLKNEVDKVKFTIIPKQRESVQLAIKKKAEKEEDDIASKIINMFHHKKPEEIKPLIAKPRKLKATKCPECGNTLIEGAKFCGKCGKKL